MSANDNKERRPIVTASRDGTLIWVGADDSGEFVMRYDPEGENVIAQAGKGLWVASDGSFTWSEERGFGPDYWRVYNGV